MKQEIERKFRVTDDSWRASAGEGMDCHQGYLSSGPCGVTVRVRQMGSRGYLTIKGPTRGISREEFEYEIPADDAIRLLETLCIGGFVRKKRYRVSHGGQLWEVDEFFDDNAGLVLAELELECEEQSFERPVWLGDEVSQDRRYSNAALARCPFRTWPKSA